MGRASNKFFSFGFPLRQCQCANPICFGLAFETSEPTRHLQDVTLAFRLPCVHLVSLTEEAKLRGQESERDVMPGSSTGVNRTRHLGS